MLKYENHLLASLHLILAFLAFFASPTGGSENSEFYFSGVPLYWDEAMSAQQLMPLNGTAEFNASTCARLRHFQTKGDFVCY